MASSERSSLEGGAAHLDVGVLRRLGALSVRTRHVSRARLRGAGDALVLAFHNALLECDFRLVEVEGANDTLNEQTYDGLVVGATGAGGCAVTPPEGWNENVGVWGAFEYTHTQSAMRFVLKFVQLGDKLLVHGTAKEDGRVISIELGLNDYVDASRFKELTQRLDKIAANRESESDEEKEEEEVDFASVFSNLQRLIGTFKADVVLKLVPGLAKEGYESARAPTTSEIERSRRPPQPRPRRPAEDEYYDPDDPLRAGPPRRGRGRVGYPPYLGRGDLYGDLPAGGFGASGGFGHAGEMGGQMGPDHPMFRGRVPVGPTGIRDPYGEGSLPQRLPPGAVPPGARFDPFGPPGVGPGRGGPYGGGGGVPDPDHLRHPGFDDNWYM